MRNSWSLRNFDVEETEIFTIMNHPHISVSKQELPEEVDLSLPFTVTTELAYVDLVYYPESAPFLQFEYDYKKYIEKVFSYMQPIDYYNLSQEEQNNVIERLSETLEWAFENFEKSSHPGILGRVGEKLLPVQSYPDIIEEASLYSSLKTNIYTEVYNGFANKCLEALNSLKYSDDEEAIEKLVEHIKFSAALSSFYINYSRMYKNMELETLFYIAPYNNNEEFIQKLVEKLRKK